MLEQYKKKVYKFLDKAVKENVPDGVLLSGGIDSSAIAYLAKKYNKKLTCVTIISEDRKSPDKSFAELICDRCNIKNHELVPLKEDEVSDLIKNAVLSVGTFNIYWIAASIVLLKGLTYAKKIGLKKIATGEGSDDIFGSFPVMLNWPDGDNELKKFILTRIKDIDVMTKKISDYLGIKIVTPFYSKELVDFTLQIPLNLKTKTRRDGSKITKYILRESFKKVLPKLVLSRPQTMAFIGASTLDLLTNKYAQSMDVLKFRKKYKINFSNPFECYLFDILNKAGKYQPLKTGHSCIYCSSKLRAKNSVHCTVCGTLQYKNKILQF